MQIKVDAESGVMTLVTNSLDIGNAQENLICEIEGESVDIAFNYSFLLALLTLFFVALYTWLPYERQDIRLQLPGALISTVGWIGCSYGFSIYFNHFSNYSYMYGSLTAVVILMLWLYACILPIVRRWFH